MNTLLIFFLFTKLKTFDLILNIHVYIIFKGMSHTLFW